MQNHPKIKRKPTFVGLNTDKLKAVIADEPGLDPLSVQLGRFEKEVLGYAKAAINANVAKAMRKLTPVDFTELQYLPKPVDPRSYTTVLLKNQ